MFCHVTLSSLGSGRPHNILAGVDPNGDGDGGATDRARTSLTDINTSVMRNASRSAKAGAGGGEDRV